MLFTKNLFQSFIRDVICCKGLCFFPAQQRNKIIIKERAFFRLGSVTFMRIFVKKAGSDWQTSCILQC